MSLMIEVSRTFRCLLLSIIISYVRLVGALILFHKVSIHLQFQVSPVVVARTTGAEPRAPLSRQVSPVLSIYHAFFRFLFLVYVIPPTRRF